MLQTRDINTVITSQKDAFLPLHFYAYGLGVFISDYGGKMTYEHTGGVDGFVTNTCFVPEENLGIAIFTNNDNQEFYELLRYQILDAYVGLPYRNYSELLLPDFLQRREETVNRLHKLQARVKSNKPSLSLSAYAGTYYNELFGNIVISAGGGDLHIKFLNHYSLTGLLQYMDHDEWLLTYNNPSFGILPLTFNSENKKVISVDVPMNEFIELDPYTFIKQ
jgi:hypothetical protein